MFGLDAHSKPLPPAFAPPCSLEAPGGRHDLDSGPSRAPVALVDRDPAVRRSMAAFLEGRGYRVLAYASGGAFLAARPAEPPACLLLDLGSALDVLRALADREDAPATVVLAGRGEVALAVEAMKLNAADVIERPCPPRVLLRALEQAAVLRGQAHAAREETNEARALIEALPPRHRQILAGMVAGSANKVIAFELGLSVRTVEAYRARLLARLRVRSTAEAIRIAVAAGL
jgi:two-component system, LuxR family, response regulator FixJ